MRLRNEQDESNDFSNVQLTLKSTPYQNSNRLRETKS